MNPQSEKKMANGDRLAETMTKREAFAMAAMQGFCAIPLQGYDGSKALEHDTLRAVLYADALLAELEKRNG